LPTSIQAFRVQPDARFTDDVPFELLPPEIKLTNFSDTARWLETLDLVITVDTSVAHLAGGLGVHVWILLPYAPDWRWGTNGETTNWYGAARLIRQTKPSDWISVLHRIQNMLS
jgi:ADP-heptose:LPS heptosyltransferase